jgi:hypothetical protein
VCCRQKKKEADVGFIYSVQFLSISTSTEKTCTGVPYYYYVKTTKQDEQLYPFHEGENDSRSSENMEDDDTSSSTSLKRANIVSCLNSFIH